MGSHSYCVTNRLIYRCPNQTHDPQSVKAHSESFSGCKTSAKPHIPENTVLREKFIKHIICLTEVQTQRSDWGHEHEHLGVSVGNKPDPLNHRLLFENYLFFCCI